MVAIILGNGELIPFVIVGFVNFLFGFYVIVISKRSRVGTIGHHYIYKIEDSEMLYIPYDVAVATTNNDEQRYLRCFQTVNISSNFYFRLVGVLPSFFTHLRGLWERKHWLRATYHYSHILYQPFVTFSYSYDLSQSLQWHIYNDKVGVRHGYESKFAWNEYLLSPLYGAGLHSDWILVLIYGFMRQTSTFVWGILGGIFLRTYLPRGKDRVLYLNG